MPVLPRLFRPWCVVLLMVSALGAPAPAAAQGAPAVAAASDLKFALDEIAAMYLKQTGQPVRISYGSSGNFMRQIQQDAPFELFLSADEAFVFQLADQGRTVDRGTLYATGRIVLFAPKASAWQPDARLAGLRAALAEGRITRFAIANPEHAPYGRAAREALQAAGLWEAMQRHLVLGENVSQAAQFAVSGSAQGGIFAYSLVLAPSFANAGRYMLVPEHMHQPLRQRMVLTRKAGAAARAFHAFLQQPAARGVFQRYGFVLPGTAPN
jgi:molybdate transport system substrate-binding protein